MDWDTKALTSCDSAILPNSVTLSDWEVEQGKAGVKPYSVLGRGHSSTSYLSSAVRQGRASSILEIGDLLLLLLGGISVGGGGGAGDTPGLWTSPE